MPVVPFLPSTGCSPVGAVGWAVGLLPLPPESAPDRRRRRPVAAAVGEGDGGDEQHDDADDRDQVAARLGGPAGAAAGWAEGAAVAFGQAGARQVAVGVRAAGAAGVVAVVVAAVAAAPPRLIACSPLQPASLPPTVSTVPAGRPWSLFRHAGTTVAAWTDVWAWWCEWTSN